MKFNFIKRFQKVINLESFIKLILTSGCNFYLCNYFTKLNMNLTCFTVI